MIFLPFLISATIGYLLLELVTRKNKALNLPLRIILGTGLGLGLSSHLTFYSFLVFDHLEPKLIIIIHLVILAALIIRIGGLCRCRALASLQAAGKKELSGASPTHRLIKKWSILTIILLSITIVTCVIVQAKFYPYGGWDAWQVWNFKAKFLFLGGENWRDLFTPQLWRSSPHYPLLLPLINVWAWLFTSKPLDVVPMITSLGFTFLTIGLLCSALWQKTKSIYSIIPGFLLLTLPFFNLLATTQYCDIVLSFYLLAALVTLGEYKFVAGIFTGCLAFTKPEGMVAALLIMLMTLILTVKNWKNLWSFMLGLGMASLPVFAFHLWLSPGNQTFINGLTSTVKPATWERFQMIMGFLCTELKSVKWNGLWFLLLFGIILGGKDIWNKNKIIAGFLLLYLTVIVTYYQVNTYFEIKWWLSVSLNRILFSLLPLFFFWVFSGILTKKND